MMDLFEFQVMKHLGTLTTTLQSLSFKLERAEKGVAGSVKVKDDDSATANIRTPKAVSPGMSYYSDLLRTADRLRSALGESSQLAAFGEPICTA